jgi:hypothetical protein
LLPRRAARRRDGELEVALRVANEKITGALEHGVADPYFIACVFDAADGVPAPARATSCKVAFATRK